MSLLRGSTNYVWCTTSVLGKGATASVFQGVNKVNGEPVAVKTFNQLSHMRPQEVQLREFEVLKKVKHNNIVKLLAIEEEQHEGRGKVIIMELCTGGSLFNILDDPENTYGLEETAFLQVLDDTSSGMKHLRDNNLVHRDLKPGNIMKFIRDNGTTIYKLTDFGAARELPDGQQFVSLYGTEEYLHPDMYERAVLRKQVGKTFGATVDLWSIGVTLYHVATGNLPFRPYGGRRNKEKMYVITTTKASGCISGIQTTDNGPIEWGRDLPHNCQLSMGMKKIVTPLLAGLLEADSKRVWSFEKFFQEVRYVLARKLLHIFYVNRATSIKIYVPPDETYSQLQNYIEDQTGCKPEHQLILYKNTLFVNAVGENSRAAGYPNDTDVEPLMLFSTDLQDVATIPFPDLQEFPTFSQVVSVENDAAQAKIACSISHVCKRRVEKCAQATQYMRRAVDYFTDYLKNELRHLHKTNNHLIEITSSYNYVAKTYNTAQKTVNSLVRTPKNKLQLVDYHEDLVNFTQSFVEQTSVTVQQIYQKQVVENNLYLEWKTASRNVKCPAENLAPAKAKTLVERLRDSWQHLVRDRATRSLTYNDEQFHILERIKISGTNSRIKSLLETECIPAYSQLAELLGDWYKSGQTCYLRYKILDNDVSVYRRKLGDFSMQMQLDQIRCDEDMLAVIEAENKVQAEREEVVKNNGGEQSTSATLQNSGNEELSRKLQIETDNERLVIKKLLEENTIYMDKLNEVIRVGFKIAYVE